MRSFRMETRVKEIKEAKEIPLQKVADEWMLEKLQHQSLESIIEENNNLDKRVSVEIAVQKAMEELQKNAEEA